MPSKVRVVLDQQGAVFTASRAIERLEQYIRAYHVPVQREVPGPSWLRIRACFEAIIAHIPREVFSGRLVIVRVRPHSKKNPYISELRAQGLEAPKKKKKAVPRVARVHPRGARPFVVQHPDGQGGVLNYAQPLQVPPEQEAVQDVQNRNPYGNLRANYRRIE